MMFDGVRIPIPNNYHKFLELDYDNYMDVPLKPKKHMASNTEPTVDVRVLNNTCLSVLGQFDSKDKRLWLMKLARIIQIRSQAIDSLIKKQELSGTEYQDLLSEINEHISNNLYYWNYSFEQVDIGSKKNTEIAQVYNLLATQYAHWGKYTDLDKSAHYAKLSSEGNPDNHDQQDN